MSNINCDSCADLREYAPEFVQNGVTDTISASLKNNTGFNPRLTTLHENCPDLNDANDCLIGRMADEVEAYDVCDWKVFMKKHLGNLYEMLKAIIASTCGMWSRVSRLCAGLDAVMGLIQGSVPPSHYGEWTAKGYEQLTPRGSWDKDKYKPALQADILTGIGCDSTKRLGRWGLAIDYTENVYPQNPGYNMNGYTYGDIWAYFRKDSVVPTYMTESRWARIMRGFNTTHFSTFGGNDGKDLYLNVRGYIVIDGQEFNADLKEEFGEDVLVMEVERIVGGGGAESFSGIGDLVHDIHSYNA